MSLNIAPVYGRQYIRYASTWEAATDAETGSDNAVAAGTEIGIVEIPEFAVVAYATYDTAPANKVCRPGDLATFEGPVVGVNQGYIPTALAQPYTARQASVASSGSLIVEVDPLNVAAFTLNAQLSVGLTGKALTVADGGVEVTVDGTTPLIREVVDIGGRHILIVSFN
jgi:hypothetical protein